MTETKKFPILAVTLAVVALLATAAFAPMVSAGHHEKKSDHAMDIIDVAVDNGNFNTLAAALKAAGLVETLKGDGPFTVFAPTDAAFAKLPAGTVESLLKPENKDQLTAILTYHVVAGKVTAAQAKAAGSAPTVEGSTVSFSLEGGEVMVNDSTVTAADVDASNGVIHVIDSVLMPN